MIDAATIIALIKKRRDQFRDSASVGSAADADGGEAAQRAWEMAAEYDTLLEEIESSDARG